MMKISKKFSDDINNLNNNSNNLQGTFNNTQRLKQLMKA